MTERGLRASPQRAVLWAAVSSKPQLQGDSIAVQVADARRFCADAGLRIVAELQVPGHSRNYIFFPDAARDMEAYRALAALCDRRAFDVLVCRARDRLGRTDALIAQVEAIVAAAGAQVYSLSMPTQLGQGKTDGDLYVAAFERAQAQVDVARLARYREFGMRRRIRNGQPASHVPYGYARDASGVVIVPAQAVAVRQMAARYLAGWGVERIADELNRQGVPPPQAARWNKNTVWKILRSPFYAGFVHWGRRRGAAGEQVEAAGQHEALFDAATWQRLQDEQRRRAQLHASGQRSARVWTGAVWCARCRSPMVAARRADGAPLYRCATHVRARSCHNNAVLERKLRAALAAVLGQMAGREEEMAAALLAQRPAPDTARGEALAAQMAAAQEERQRVTVAYVRGKSLTVEEYETLLADIDRRLAALTAELSALERAAAAVATVADLAARLRALSVLNLADADPQEARAVLARGVRLWCEGGRVVEIALL